MFAAVAAEPPVVPPWSEPQPSPAGSTWRARVSASAGTGAGAADPVSAAVVPASGAAGAAAAPKATVIAAPKATASGNLVMSFSSDRGGIRQGWDQSRIRQGRGDTAAVRGCDRAGRVPRTRPGRSPAPGPAGRPASP